MSDRQDLGFEMSRQLYDALVDSGAKVGCVSENEVLLKDVCVDATSFAQDRTSVLIDLSSAEAPVVFVDESLRYRGDDEHVTEMLAGEKRGLWRRLNLPEGATGEDFDRLLRNVLGLLGFREDADHQPSHWLTWSEAARMRDLIVAAPQMPPVVQREAEIQRLADVLCRRDCRAAALVGPPGAGRRSIVVGLAQAIAGLRNPDAVSHLRPVEIDARLAEATVLFGNQTSRLQGEIAVAGAAREAGPSAPTSPAAGSARPQTFAVHLGRGEPGRIFVLDPRQAEAMAGVWPDAPLEVTQIAVEPADRATAREMLAANIPALDAHHALSVPRTMVARAVRMAALWVEGALPGSAVKLLDEACSHARRVRPKPNGETRLLLSDLVAVAENYADTSAVWHEVYKKN